MAISRTLKHAKQRTKSCTKTEHGIVENLTIKVTANKKNTTLLISHTTRHLFVCHYEIS